MMNMHEQHAKTEMQHKMDDDDFLSGMLSAGASRKLSSFSDFVGPNPGHVRKRCQASGSLSAKPQIN